MSMCLRQVLSCVPCCHATCWEGLLKHTSYSCTARPPQSCTKPHAPLHHPPLCRPSNVWALLARRHGIALANWLVLPETARVLQYTGVWLPNQNQQWLRCCNADVRPTCHFSRAQSAKEATVHGQAPSLALRGRKEACKCIMQRGAAALIA